MEDGGYYKQMCSRLTLQNKKEGFFRDLVETISPMINLSAFTRCKNDLERITLVSDRCWHIIGSELVFRGKNEEESVAKRIEGNVAFEKGDYPKALLYYAQSIIRAPTGQSLSLVYANRSALLQRMGEYEPAIIDVELAISSGYEEKNRHKLYERMGSCYLALGKVAKAQVSLNLAKHLASKQEPKDMKFIDKCDSLLNKIKGKCEKEEKNVNDENLIEDLSKTLTKTQINSKSKSPIFPSASAKFNVKSDGTNGRFAFANEEIDIGEDILIEKPFAAVLLPERMGSHCLHCFKRFRVVIPCETCANVGFCSKKCRSEGEIYHRYECRILALLIGSGMSILPFLAYRILTQSNPDEFLQKLPFPVEQDSFLLTAEGKYDEREYGNIYNLSGLETMRHPQDFLERTIMAIFLMKALRSVGYFQVNLFKNPEPTNEELLVGSIILRNLQVLQFNAYEFCEFIMETKDNFRKATSSSLGLAVYSTASFFNHSCAPNTTRYFTGGLMVVRTIRKINLGEPIYDNYGPLFTRMRRGERMHRLEGRYWFTCSCLACTADWPLMPEMNLEIEAKEKKELKLLKQLKSLEDSLYDKALPLMDSGKGEMAIILLESYLRQAGRLIEEIKRKNDQFPPYKTVFLAVEALKLCLAARGSLFVKNNS